MHWALISASWLATALDCTGHSLLHAGWRIVLDWAGQLYWFTQVAPFASAIVGSNQVSGGALANVVGLHGTMALAIVLASAGVKQATS